MSTSDTTTDPTEVAEVTVRIERTSTSPHQVRYEIVDTEQLPDTMTEAFADRLFERIGVDVRRDLPADQRPDVVPSVADLPDGGGR